MNKTLPEHMPEKRAQWEEYVIGNADYFTAYKLLGKHKFYREVASSKEEAVRLCKQMKGTKPGIVYAVAKLNGYEHTAHVCNVASEEPTKEFSIHSRFQGYAES